MATRIDLIQNTPKWHNFRKKHIGASMAPIIQGCGYKSTYWLFGWFLGLKPDEEENNAMKYGKQMESSALEKYNQIQAKDYTPMVFESDVYPYISASLDGVCLQDNDLLSAVEIKCPQPTMMMKMLSGEYTEAHYAQVQHQMFVLDLPRMDLFAYSPTVHRIITIERDQKYIDGYVEKVVDFWRRIENLDAPEPTDQDYTLQDSNEWFNAAAFYRDAKEELKKWEAVEKFYRDKLIELSQGNNSKGHGVKLTKIISKGRVDYNAIPELIGLDLTPYRKQNIESYRISLE